jgi:hypothetical protein
VVTNVVVSEPEDCPRKFLLTDSEVQNCRTSLQLPLYTTKEALRPPLHVNNPKVKAGESAVIQLLVPPRQCDYTLASLQNTTTIHLLQTCTRKRRIEARQLSNKSHAGKNWF